MKVSMRRIDCPAWAKPPQKTVADDFDRLVLELIEHQRPHIEQFIEKVVNQYIQTESSELQFPEENRLSGEFYLSDWSFWVRQPNRYESKHGIVDEYRFSVMIHCLEKPNFTPIENRDYLGLEVHMSWDKESERIVFRGDVDSSSI